MIMAKVETVEEQSSEFEGVIFDNPPVIEIALAVQFDPIQQLSSSVLGAFWSEVKERFPQMKQLQPLPEVMLVPPERKLGENWPEFVFNKPGTSGHARLALSTAGGDRILQLQNSKLVYNWKKVGASVSPGFSRLRGELQELFAGLCRFANAQPKVQIIECSYVNHIDVASEDLYEQVFPFVRPRDLVARAEGGCCPADLNVAQVSQWIPEVNGLVEANAQTRLFGAEGAQQKKIVLSISGRSVSVKDGQGSDVLDGRFVELQKRVLEGFMSCSSAVVKEEWGWRVQ